MAIASPVGEIILFATPTGGISGTVELASGWLLCNGASVAKATYPDLWAIFSQNDTVVSPWDYGAPDVNNFKLPNLLGRMAIGVSGTYGLGVTGGEETHTITAAELPAHLHTGASTSTIASHVHTADFSTNQSVNHYHGVTYLYTTTFATASSGGTLRDIYEHTHASANTDSEFTTDDSVGHTHSWTSAATGDHGHTATISASGSGSAHNNLPPYITLCYLIKY